MDKQGLTVAINPKALTMFAMDFHSKVVHRSGWWLLAEHKSDAIHE